MDAELGQSEMESEMRWRRKRAGRNQGGDQPRQRVRRVIMSSSSSEEDEDSEEDGEAGRGEWGQSRGHLCDRSSN
jgi:hypothetical protein